MKWLPVFALLIICLASCSKDGDQKSRFEIYNKGGDGNTTAHLLGRVDKDVIDLRPKLVIIMIGTNDVNQNIPFTQFKANLASVINRIKIAGADVLLMSPPPRGVDVISFPEYEHNDITDTITKIHNELSKELGCYYLDMNKLFKDAGTPNPTASSMIFNAANNPERPDGIHPNAKGMLFIATKLFNFMQANLPSIKSGDVTIVCFGDSITWGAGSNLSYPSQLSKLLN
ncbi:MAG: hypothetical protein EOP47_19140 [Sphingobacteriaceae bacterium]|nr:MAG: hypothetical protein EOP47_19140 [Sphingobacteriaceae bacterium]